MKDVTPEEKHATLLLLLLQLKDGFVKTHVEKTSSLEGIGGSKHQMYIVHAALLSKRSL